VSGFSRTSVGSGFPPTSKDFLGCNRTGPDRWRPDGGRRRSTRRSHWSILRRRLGSSSRITVSICIRAATSCASPVSRQRLVARVAARHAERDVPARA
jgi:hypothetical protein